MRPMLARLLTAALLVALVLVAGGGVLSGPTRWTPDGLFYEARALQLDGEGREASLTRTFQGPRGDELRRIDPTRAGDPEWVSFNARFYERRVAVPLAANAIRPVAGDRALLDVSLAGYVAAVLAVFGLLLALRLPLWAAGGVGALTALLPALTTHASYPLTDSWGLALETAAFAAAVLVLDPRRRRRRAWLAGWAAAVLVLSFVRDSAWIPVLAAAAVALRYRSRPAGALLAGGLAALAPVMLLFPLPIRELVAAMLNDAQPAPDPSWGFILERYPGALEELLRANGGFVRDGAWPSALFLVAGLAALFLLGPGRPAAQTLLLRAGAVVSVAYVFVVPVFSAFRLELVAVPMAAAGLGFAAERLGGLVRASATRGATTPEGRRESPATTPPTPRAAGGLEA